MTGNSGQQARRPARRSVKLSSVAAIEFGLNKTEYGKTVLAACFVNDLATVIALGLIFASFTLRTLIFVGLSHGIITQSQYSILVAYEARSFRRSPAKPNEVDQGMDTWLETEAAFARPAATKWLGFFSQPNEKFTMLPPNLEPSCAPRVFRGQRVGATPKCNLNLGRG